MNRDTHRSAAATSRRPKAKAKPKASAKKGRTRAPDPSDPCARARHARYFERGVVYHVISRTRGNLFLLRPDRGGELRRVIAGVLAEAKHNWPSVANFATSVLSNHLHCLVAVAGGDPRDISEYIAFVKRETTRRWRTRVRWVGSMWAGLECAAVLTHTAQVDALAYIIGQGCKENLVADPRQWPGFHCAESLVSGRAIDGVWLDGTGFGKARHAELAKKEPAEVRPEDYTTPRQFAFDVLPALAGLSDKAYRRRMLELVEEQMAERQRAFAAPALGPEAVCATKPMTSRPVPRPPWFEQRKRFIVWDDRRAPEVVQYLRRYWDHQIQYRAAAAAWRAGKRGARGRFPDYCFLPGLRSRPIAHMETSAA